MPTLAQIANALGGEVTGRQVRAPGPGHTDADRSLSVSIGADGDILVHSFASDDPLQCKDYVRSRLGMPAWEPKRRKPMNRHAAPEEKIRRAYSKASRTEVARYDYVGLDGVPLYQVRRYEPKTF